MTGTIDLGIIHGEIQIVCWKNRDKKETKHPDYVINLSEPKKAEVDAGPIDVETVDVAASAPKEAEIDPGDIPY